MLNRAIYLPSVRGRYRMATLPTDRISAGLDARRHDRDSAAQRRTPQPVAALLGPGARPVPRRSGEDLVSQASAILTTERSLREMIVKAGEEMREAEVQITAQWTAEKSLPREMAQDIAREKGRERVAEIRAETRVLIDSIVRDCAGAAEALAQQQPMYHSRAQSLSLVGLGTPVRQALEQTAAASGRTGLLSLGQLALAEVADPDPTVREHGVLLSSVLCLEVGRRPPEERPFSPSAILDEVPLPEYEAGARAIRQGNSALTNIGRMAKEFATSRASTPQPRSLERVFDQLDELGGRADE
jgi:hypothetical protein